MIEISSKKGMMLTQFDVNMMYRKISIFKHFSLVFFFYQFE